MPSTEDFYIESGVASIRIRGVLLNVYFDAEAYKDSDYRNRPFTVFDNVIIKRKRDVVYNDKPKEVSERLQNLIEETILSGLNHDNIPIVWDKGSGDDWYGEHAHVANEDY
jgi:hypothetical protein